MTEPPDLKHRSPSVTFDGVIALLLGLITLGFGIVLVLAPVSQGFLFVPIGAFAAGFGLRGMRDQGLRAAPVLPLVGAVAGILGAVLIVIGLIRSWLAF